MLKNENIIEEIRNYLKFVYTHLVVINIKNLWYVTMWKTSALILLSHKQIKKN